MTIAEKIRHHLKRTGLSMRRASIMAGGNPDLVKDIMSGKSQNPRYDHLKALAVVFGVTVEELAGDGKQTVSQSSRETPRYDFGVPELDVRLGAGGGGIPAPLTDGTGEVTDSEAVVQRWGIPDDYARRDLRTSTARLRIASVVGDSMTPTLNPHDKVMIDTGHNVPSPDGIYALWDGYGVVVKRVEIVPRSDPKRVKVISDNPSHSAYELADGEVAIIGRVVAVIRAL